MSPRGPESSNDGKDIGEQAVDTLRYTRIYRPTTVYVGVTPLYDLMRLSRRASESEPYDVEELSVRGCSMIRIPKAHELRYCQDACGIVLNEHAQVRSFALADGVGAIDCIAAQHGAHVAVNDFLARISLPYAGSYDERVMKDFVKIAESALNASFNIDGLREELLDKMHVPDVRRRYGGVLSRKIDTLSEDSGTVGNTTLTLGHIQNNVLHVARAGDTEYCVVNRERIVHAENAPYRYAPNQISANGARISEYSIDYRAINLADGDIVVASTDWFTKTSLGSMDQVAGVVQNRVRDGTPLHDIADQLVTGNEGADDITLLLFQYGAQH